MVVQGAPVPNWYRYRGAGIFREEFVQKFCLLQWQSTLKAVCNHQEKWPVECTQWLFFLPRKTSTSFKWQFLEKFHQLVYHEVTHQ